MSEMDKLHETIQKERVKAKEKAKTYKTVIPQACLISSKNIKQDTETKTINKEIAIYWSIYLIQLGIIILLLVAQH